MRSPLECGTWHDFVEVPSTQDVAAAQVLLGVGGVFFAQHQTGGRGRFDRKWVSQAGDSLTMSLAFLEYADHGKPYIIGMAVAVAAAAVLSCDLKWPNDLVADGKKVGGILTEIRQDNRGRSIPIVGVGINLNQKHFPPEIAGIANSIALYKGGSYDAKSIAEEIVKRLSTLPEPDSWAALAPLWNLFDHTPGKDYRLNTGEVVTALGIGPDGQLVASVNGATMELYAAEAIFGTR